VKVLLMKNLNPMKSSSESKIVHGLLTDRTESRLGQIIDCKILSRLIVTKSLVLKFGRKLLDKVRNSKGSFDPAEAEQLWILTDWKFEKWKRQLDLFQDDKGVW
jgi:hypothetical protein